MEAEDLENMKKAISTIVIQKYTGNVKGLPGIVCLPSHN